MATATAGQPQASSTFPPTISWTYSVSGSFTGTWTAQLYQSIDNGLNYTPVAGTVVTGSATTGGTITAPLYTTPTTSYYYRVQVSGGNISPSVTGTSLYFFSAYQGPQGVQGNPGVQGTPGVQGNQGPQGIQGVQGIVAINGYTTNGSNQLVTTADATHLNAAGTSLTWNGSTLNVTGNVTASSINNGNSTFTITSTTGTNSNTLTVGAGNGTGNAIYTTGTINATSTGTHSLGLITHTNGVLGGVTTLSNTSSAGITAIGESARPVTNIYASTVSSVTNLNGITLSGTAVSGMGTLGCGAITAPTTANTINSLVINAGTCTGVDFVATSDRRLKSDISSISNALGLVKNMRGVYFTRLGQSKRSVGVIAQEVEEVLPEVVHTGDDEMKSVSYGNIVGLLIEANKELTQRLESLEKLMVMK